MTMLYPIVLETEESGAVSAYVPGLPVYAAADSHVSVVGVAALVGAQRSEAKARASRANGRLGGRPPNNATTRTTRAKASRWRVAAPHSHRPSRGTPPPVDLPEPAIRYA
jgi:hypothetical protein